MNVAIDMQLAIGTATGIGEYVRGLARALREAGIGVIELAEPSLDPWRFDRRLAWDQVLLPLRARRSGADLLHCASGTMPLYLPLPAVVTVHDVAWLKVQAHARPYARLYFGSVALRRYRHAQAIAVDSAFSRDELLALLDVAPERVHVVYPGVSAEFCRINRRPGGDAVILVPGTVERRKNLEVLIRALALLPGARVISVGPFTPYAQECAALAASLGVGDRLEMRGYVERGQLLDLYATCSAVAVPSRYEGFGYAAAQGLCAGVPLAVADAASLPEVVAGAAPLLACDDADGWAGALRKLLGDRAGAQARADCAREDAIARFSWDTSAQKMTHVYAQALQQRQR